MPPIPRCAEQQALYQDEVSETVAECASRVLRTPDNQTPLLYAVACRATVEVMEDGVYTYGNCVRNELIAGHDYYSVQA